MTVAPNRSNGCGATDQCNNGYSGTNTAPGTTSANLQQQQYFADSLTRAILPSFKQSSHPFFVLYWSRDPDGTQHNQGDSLNSLTPGINGPTSRAAVRNADNNLRQLLNYVQNDPNLRGNTAGQSTAALSQRPASADGVIGGTGKVQDVTDAEVIVAANGGSDLIYVPSKNPQTVAKLVAFLSTQDYTGGLFVDDDYGNIPGSLPLSSIGLVGSAQLPRPTIALNFRSFATNSLDKVNSRVEFADTGLQQGQGMHGNLSRADTFINMAAWGPDFKRHYTDRLPAANSDIAPTLATILNLNLTPNGGLVGRILSEALRNDATVEKGERLKYISAPTQFGRTTVLLYQKLGSQTYYDEACVADDETAASQKNPCR